MDTPESDTQFAQFVAEYRAHLSQLVKVHSIVPISCYTGQGLDELQNLLYDIKYGSIKMANIKTS